jgi:CHAD domain-containing protein
MAASAKWIEGIGPESAVDDAARRSLEPRLATVAHCLPLAAHLAEHDIEHVHRLRVGTRRASAALKLYRDLLPRRARRWVKKRLRKIRRAAGDARDFDVLATRLVEDYGHRVAPIVEIVLTERVAVQSGIIDIADSCRRDDRFARKTSKLIEGIQSPENHDNGEHDAERFSKWAAAELGKVADKFVGALPDETSDVVALHQFRIRAKRLRYAIELVARGFGPELREDLFPIIEEVQERLGRVQDLVSARARFQTWSARDIDHDQRTLLYELSLEESRRQADEVQDFHAWWSGDQHDRARAMLSSVLGDARVEHSDEAVEHHASRSS